MKDFKKNDLIIMTKEAKITFSKRKGIYGVITGFSKKYKNIIMVRKIFGKSITSWSNRFWKNVKCPNCKKPVSFFVTEKKDSIVFAVICQYCHHQKVINNEFDI